MRPADIGQEGAGIYAPDGIVPSRLVAALVFILALSAAFWLLPLLHLAPNRLVTGAPIDARSALGALAPTIAALAILASLALGLSRCCDPG